MSKLSWRYAAAVAAAACAVALSGCGAADHAGAAGARVAHDGVQRLLAAAADRGASSARASALLLLRDTTRPTALQGWASARGLAVAWRSGASFAELRGPAPALADALGVAIHDYRTTDGHTFYASWNRPAVPAALRTSVRDVARPSSYQLQVHAVPSGGVNPQVLLAAYDATPLRDAGFDGSGMTVVFPEADSLSMSDLKAYDAKQGLPEADVTILGTDPGQAEGEATMDVEVVHAIAPKAKLVVAYVAGGRVSAIPDTISQAAQAYPGAVFSSSIGACERGVDPAVMQAMEQTLEAAEKQGTSFFTASGDSLAFDCMGPDATSPGQDLVSADWPASLPAATGVGGTRLSVRQDGSWLSEEAWIDPIQSNGTGGGLSVMWKRPDWQQAPGVAAGGVDGSVREVPDVSADADPASGTALVMGGDASQGGGTSQAAPIWAGLTVLMNQYLVKNGGHQLGFANPMLYRLAASSQQFPPFHDVTLGSNGVNAAGAGFDLATGLGTPDTYNLARDILAAQKNGDS